MTAVATIAPSGPSSAKPRPSSSSISQSAGLWFQWTSVDSPKAAGTSASVSVRSSSMISISPSLTPKHPSGHEERDEVPYLQVDLPGPAGADVKRRFAQRLAELYAEAMLTQAHIPSIAFRELGPGNLVRLQDGILQPVL